MYMILYHFLLRVFFSDDLSQKRSDAPRTLGTLYFPNLQKSTLPLFSPPTPEASGNSIDEGML